MSADDFWNDHEAAVALNDALATLKKIQVDRDRWQWEMPHHVTVERDRASETVRAAVRYFCADEDES